MKDLGYVRKKRHPEGASFKAGPCAASVPSCVLSFLFFSRFLADWDASSYRLSQGGQLGAHFVRQEWRLNLGKISQDDTDLNR